MAKLASIFLIAFVAHVILAAPQTGQTYPSKIHPILQTSLKSKANVDILVSFEGGTAGVLDKIAKQSFNSRANRALAVSEVLQARAAESQNEVLHFLDKQLNSVKKIKSLWVSNQIYVRGASAELVQAISEYPNVSEIKEDEWIPLESIYEGPGKSPMESGILAEWGVETINAPGVWAAPNGNNGTGVIISTIDTGVLATHEALVNNYLGQNGGWRDPYEETATPNDQNGHGTHTTGNIAGSHGIGVAPGARWSACKGCSTSSCSTFALLDCGQWTVCPNAACTNVPNLSSNSWGGGRGNKFFDPAIEAMRAANVVVLFSNGNSGSSCNSANSPADSLAGVIGVGSTTSADALSSFSSKGPTIHGLVKPDISAPGSSVNSAYHTSNNAYAVLSGTSMACPHVAGTVALLLSRNPNLNQKQVARLLYDGAEKNVQPTGQNCGGISDSYFPNHSYGHGRVDALNSFNQLLETYKQ